MGRNCRFLQGPATDPDAVAEIRTALAEQRTVTTTLLNYRKDGSAFWNQLSISPVFDGEGTLVSFVGVQTDVTERVRVEHEREAAFAAEQAARQEAELAQSIAEQAQSDAEKAQSDAERAQGRLALMAEATSTLIATLDMSELLDQLAGLLVPRLADWAYVTLLDDYGDVREFAARHRDGREDGAAGVRRPPRAAPRTGIAQPPEHGLLPAGPAHRARPPRCSTRSSPTRAPWRAFQRLGAAQVAQRADGRPAPHARGDRPRSGATPTARFTQDDVDLAADLGSRAALAIDNVRLYQREHAVADTLQRSLLPELPDVAGIETAAHYVSASSAADVGGDFYDLLALPDGSVAIVVGDVVGHDVAAAAAMGHLRGLLRACIWDSEEADPGGVLARVDRLVQGLRVASLATMVYARALRPVGDGEPWRVHVANAGHPPMLLRQPNGSVEILSEITGMLVGVDAESHRESVVLQVPRGATLLAYTDGLIERPGHDMDEGIHELCERIMAAPVDAGPRELCDVAVRGALDHRDDVALIAVRFR